MKKIFIIIIALLHVSNCSFAQNTPATTTAPVGPFPVSPVTLPAAFISTTSTFAVSNLTRNFVPMVPLTNEAATQFNYNPTGGLYNAMVSTTYTNGWGGDILTIKRGNATVKDIIQPYDLRPSLTSTSFLPFTLASSGYWFLITPFTYQKAYYNTKYPAEDSRGYSQSVVSYPSGVPTVSSYSPGASFVGKGNGITMTTTVNTGAENIMDFGIHITSGLPYKTGFYGASQLSVKTTTSPHNGKVIEYTDKNGRAICKQVYTGATSASPVLSTYYVYNDLGQIIHVITPEGARRAVNPLANLTRLMHTYRYNKYGSPTETYNPDQDGPTYTIYDNKNRPVMTQTPLMRAQQKFRFTIYDSYDRPVFSGIYKEMTPGQNHVWWQNAIYTTIPSAPAPTELLYYILNGAGTGYLSGMPAITDCEIEQVNLYDRYHIPRTYYTGGSWLSIQSNAVAPVPYMVTNKLLTTSLVRVRDGGLSASSDLWVCSVFFYDVKGHVIQTQTAKGATYSTCLGGGGSTPWDVASTQYTFAGNKIREYYLYNDFAASDKHSTEIVNFYYLDLNYGERLDRWNQSIDGGAQVAIANYTYDDLGNVTQKILGTAETQKYDYNIRGQLTSINRDYVNNHCGPAGQISTFGSILSYDFGFDKPRYDGKISGMRWAGASHTMPIRAYGYDYDAAGRIKSADFRHFCDPGGSSVSCILSASSEVWNKSKTDFTMSNVTYDYNGNIKSMTQRGTTSAGPVDMDVLTYAYTPGTNRLASVTDAVTIDHNLGEFVDVYSDCTLPPDDPDEPDPPLERGSGGKGSLSAGSFSLSGSNTPGRRSLTVGSSDDGVSRGGLSAGSSSKAVRKDFSTGSSSDGISMHSLDGESPVAEAVPGSPSFPCDDYKYDEDGNLIADKNKHMEIIYNEDDLPIEVTFADGGYIKNMYTATGTLVRKEIHTVGTTGGIPPGDRVYRYWGPFVYMEDVTAGTGSGLQYVLHPEGRARYVAATNLFVYDFFVKDHLGNVRTVVTKNVTNAASSGSGGSTSLALLKTYLATHEIALSGLEAALFMHLDNVRFTKPAITSTSDVKAAKLNGGDPDRRVGTAIMLKVMAGDRFDIKAKSYWTGSPFAPSTSSSNMANAVIGALTDAQKGMTMGEGTGAQLVTEAFSPENYSAYQSILNVLSNPLAPNAFINYLVFDEKMHLLPLESGAIQVSMLQGNWRGIGSVIPIKINKNGYISIYVSNSSKMDVHFDDLQVNVYPGTLIQEQHYYPFGLAINEGEHASIVKNKFKYQGKEITDASDLQLYDFGPRQYDPQIGRFWGVDPMSQFPSGYTGMGNEPESMIDPTGAWASASSNGSIVGTEGKSSGAGSAEVPNLENNSLGASEDKAVIDEWQKSLNKDNSSEVGESNVADNVVASSASNGGGDQDGGPAAATVIGKRRTWVGRALNTVVDVVQTALDVVGLIPGAGEVADGINAAIYLARGDYSNAALSAAAMIPFAGMAATGTKIGRRVVSGFQKHHVIPKAVYREFATELKAIGFVQDAGTNLKRLPTPFHGNHPAYSKRVMQEMRNLRRDGDLNLQNMQNLQHKLRMEINNVYLDGANRLNDYYKTLGY